MEDTATAAPSPWDGAELLVVQPAEVVISEGDVSDDVYELVDGALEVLRGAEQARIATVQPGDTIGELAALAACPRTATVRATERSTLRRVSRDEFARWLAEDERRLDELTDVARARIDGHRMIAMISELLGVDSAVAADVARLSHWVRLDAGEVLFAEGDHSDAGYLVVSGRLLATRGGVDLGEVARGEIVGEVGLIERSPRTATVTALRESTLARFDVDAFHALAAAHPSLMLQLSRTILARITRPQARTDRARTISVAVTALLDTRATVSRLAEELRRHGQTLHLWAARVDAALGRDGIVESDYAVTLPALSEYLHEAETTHDYLVLEIDVAESRWTRRALTLADRIVVLATSDPDDDEARRVRAIVAAAPERTERWLVLVHPADTERPTGSAELAARLGFERVAHVRAGSSADLRRVARIASGNATGLVLGGGGARGFAHLGVWRAMDELGVEVDVIGGASIGAPLGALMALQIPPAELVPLGARLFHDLLDYTVPIVSLIKGQRITRNITEVCAGMDVRDVWLPYFCVSTNLTRSDVELHDHGDAATAIRASVAIPGVLPPVPLGEQLLVDGGVLNNLPCDVMLATGMVRQMIAVDLSPAVGPRAKEDYGLSVSGWRALREKFGSSQSRFPGLVAILMRSMVAGSVRDRDRFLEDGTLDLHLNLDLRGIALLDFERVAEVADRGYELARPQLQAWLDEAG